MAGPLRCAGAGCVPTVVGPAPTEGRQQGAVDDRLCAGCRRRLCAQLRRLPTLYDLCGQVLGGGRSGERTRVSGGGAPTGLPFNEAASDVRAAMLTVLSSWSGLVAEEWGTPPPRREVPALCTFLADHEGWLARHPSAGELSREIADLTRQAARVADPTPSRRLAAGPCVADGCAGMLTAVMRLDDGGRPVEVHCDAEPAHRWSGGEWAALDYRRRRSDDAAVGPRWLTAPQICRMWNVPSGSVYRMASEDAWRRRRVRGRTSYHEGDVTQSLERRAAAR